MRFGLLPIKPIDWDPAVTSGLSDYLSSRSREVISDLARRFEETDSLLRQFDSDLVGRILRPSLTNVISNYKTLQERMAALVAAWYWEYVYNFRDLLYMSGLVFSFYTLNSTFPGSAWANFTNFSKQLQQIASLDGFPLPMNLDTVILDDLRPSFRMVPSQTKIGEQDELWRIPVPIYGLFNGDDLIVHQDGYNGAGTGGEIQFALTINELDPVYVYANSPEFDFTKFAYYPAPINSQAVRNFGFIFDHQNLAIHGDYRISAIAGSMRKAGALATRLFASIRAMIKDKVGMLHRLLSINPTFSSRVNLSNPVNNYYSTSLDDRLKEIFEPIYSKLFTAKFNSVNWSKAITALYDSPYDDQDVISKELRPLSRPCPIYQTAVQALSIASIDHSVLLYPDSGRMILGEYWRGSTASEDRPWQLTTVRIWNVEDILPAYYKCSAIQVDSLSLSDRRYLTANFPSNLLSDEKQNAILFRPDVQIVAATDAGFNWYTAPVKAKAFQLLYNLPGLAAADSDTTVTWGGLPNDMIPMTPRLHQASSSYRFDSSSKVRAALSHSHTMMTRFESLVPVIKTSYFFGDSFGVMTGLLRSYPYRVADIFTAWTGVEWQQMLLNSGNVRMYDFAPYDDSLTYSDSVFVDPKTMEVIVPGTFADDGLSGNRVFKYEMTHFNFAKADEIFMSDSEISAYIRPLIFRSLRSPRVLSYDLLSLTDYEFDSFFNLGVIGIDVAKYTPTSATIGVLQFVRTDFDDPIHPAAGWSSDLVPLDFRGFDNALFTNKNIGVIPKYWCYYLDNFAYDTQKAPSLINPFEGLTIAYYYEKMNTNNWMKPIPASIVDSKSLHFDTNATYFNGVTMNSSQYLNEIFGVIPSYYRFKFYYDPAPVVYPTVAENGFLVQNLSIFSTGLFHENNTFEALKHIKTLYKLCSALYPKLPSSIKPTFKPIEVAAINTAVTDKLVSLIQSLYSTAGSMNRYLGLSISTEVASVDGKATLSKSLPDSLGKVTFKRNQPANSPGKGRGSNWGNRKRRGKKRNNNGRGMGKSVLNKGSSSKVDAKNENVEAKGLEKEYKFKNKNSDASLNDNADPNTKEVKNGKKD